MGEPARYQVPQDPATGLRILADWFDLHDQRCPLVSDGGDEVQQDLRRWAAEWEQLSKEMGDLRRRVGAAVERQKQIDAQVSDLRKRQG